MTKASYYIHISSILSNLFHLFFFICPIWLRFASSMSIIVDNDVLENDGMRAHLIEIQRYIIGLWLFLSWLLIKQ